jgi:alkanesulfonate monooxygenase SsuD/methylene tetrahydromethanopterin reductase-like flavin-dependent oxidoreductase (luciferase family)
LVKKMNGMKFGVFDHIERRGDSLDDLYQGRLELLREYDAAGFFGYHVAEHHATPLGMAPSPGIFLAAAAQCTRQIHLARWFTCCRCIIRYGSSARSACSTI